MSALGLILEPDARICRIRERPGTMRTLFVIFVLALIAIAFEIYSDPAMRSANIPHAADAATAAIAHGFKRE